MIVSIKGRVAEFKGRVDSYVEGDSEGRTVAHVFSETGGYGTVKVEHEEMLRLIASKAPYGREARDAYFERLREYADSVFPTRD